MDFKDLIKQRRSIRKFTEQEIDKEDVVTLMRAALMSPSSKSTRGWEFVLVDDKAMLERLSQTREKGAELIAGAAMAIVVMANPEVSDVWVEDASIAALNIQLQAEDLGLGSCWVQVRNRFTADGVPTDDAIHELLGIPANLRVLNMVAVGYKAMERNPQNEDKLQWEKVHLGMYNAAQE
ncbi:MAG: nitroreductase family protein [Bacteroidales bacterium]|nr:nitroreductase family protein [Candidatus Minthousia equi]MDO4956069.1 nitroreductase family protein [Bacteroidales bacterium]